MTALRLPRHARGDLERIADHLAAHEVEDIEARIAEALDALQLLSSHPLIGRTASGGQRAVVVAGLRGQREAGFGEG